ncbi:hypothetical protein AN964_06010 [Heyndrickxia shackletonii]|uniref:Uncharacterized protein n=1 Tax=Heyndrickxia shackletonii TaxID=157838 RepID=A0A0Q3WU93_9BACI|nr:hypothetical protein [Heyndrickxia shackletonii]KQL53108.1 hypothetical protein AN964_06010 [Heyndrickxia shackletonii]NEZ01880.1 hypothetical protein [Heyndrickxia shackletonii]
MFNLVDDFQYILDSLGIDVQINAVSTKAVITNTPVNANYDDKKINTLDVIKRGDKVTYEDGVYLIISEINGDRYGKYKGLMRRTNFIIPIKVGEEKEYVGTNDFGEPVYKITPVNVNEECIVANQTASVENGSIRLPNGNIDLMFQDNENTKKIKLNDKFSVSDQYYKVIGFDNTEIGLIIVKCEKTT